MTTPTTSGTTTSAGGASASVPQTGLEGLPGWLQPGVSPGIHIGLQIVLFVLNGLLLFCAALQLFTPHFEIMFVLSIGLTSCYFWFVWEMGKIAQKEEEEGTTAGERMKVEEKKDL